VVTRKELEDVLAQMNAIFERIERRIEILEAERKPSIKPAETKKPVGRPKKSA